jgi:ribosomal protein S18 acetylase RimI-like enzyme
MLIRTYRDADEAQVLELWRQSLDYSLAHNDPRDSIRRKMSYQPELFFVAELDGRVVGTTMGGYDGHRGWIYSVAVLPEHRRQKIATALVEHVVAELQKLDCPKINLQIAGSNAGVVGFYESLGFRVEERISMGKRMK